MIDSAQIQQYYKKYGKEKVDDAVEYLSYKKEPKPLPKTESDTEPTIYIFRHGQSVDNEAFVFSGWRTAPLTEEGKNQVKILAEKIKDKKIDMLVSSPQTRALETMKIAISLNPEAKGLEIIKDDKIMERSYGSLQGQSKLEAHLKDPEGLKKIRRDFKTIPPNGESIEMVCKRVAEFCDAIVPLMKNSNMNVAVSCHGNSFRGFRKYFENLSDEETASVETPLGQDYAAYMV